MEDKQLDSQSSTNASAQRLRGAGLRPTSARVAVLEVMEAHHAPFVSAAEICRHLVQSGARASGGTIYRTVHELEAHGFLLRILDCSRKSLYRLRRDADARGALQVVCHGDGRTIAMEDAALADHLTRSLRQLGLDLGGRAVTIYIE